MQFKAARYCTNKGTRISCIAPVDWRPAEEEKGTSQVRTFVHPKEKRLGYIMTVPPHVNSEMHFLIKIDRQKEFYVHCPHQTHWPRMAESSIPLPKVSD